MKGVLIDVGGVLVADFWPDAAATWGARLGISPEQFMTALFGGNDDQVSVGRVSEADWWAVVRLRLALDRCLLDELRADLARRETWDVELVGLLRSLRGVARTAIVSNTWPELRTRMASTGLLDIVDELVLSCDVGYAKPDPRIYEVALDRIGVRPADALFVDDTQHHVEVAQLLGIRGHVHSSTPETMEVIQRFSAAH